jgi:hypothetical protein
MHTSQFLIGKDAWREVIMVVVLYGSFIFSRHVNMLILDLVKYTELSQSKFCVFPLHHPFALELNERLLPFQGLLSPVLTSE